MIGPDELRRLQAPLKEQYREAPESAFITLRAQGAIGEGVTCSVETNPGPAARHGRVPHADLTRRFRDDA